MYYVALYFMLAVGAFLAGRWLPRALGVVAAAVAIAPAAKLFTEASDAFGWAIVVGVMAATIGYNTRVRLEPEH